MKMFENIPFHNVKESDNNPSSDPEPHKMYFSWVLSRVIHQPSTKFNGNQSISFLRNPAH